MLYSAEKGNNDSFRGKTWQLSNGYTRACNHKGQQCTFKLYNEALRFAAKGKPINEAVKVPIYAKDEKTVIGHVSDKASGKKVHDVAGGPASYRRVSGEHAWVRISEVQEGGTGSGPQKSGAEEKSYQAWRTSAEQPGADDRKLRRLKKKYDLEKTKKYEEVGNPHRTHLVPVPQLSAQEFKKLISMLSKQGHHAKRRGQYLETDAEDDTLHNIHSKVIGTTGGRGVREGGPGSGPRKRSGSKQVKDAPRRKRVTGLAKKFAHRPGETPRKGYFTNEGLKRQRTRYRPELSRNEMDQLVGKLRAQGYEASAKGPNLKTDATDKAIDNAHGSTNEAKVMVNPQRSSAEFDKIGPRSRVTIFTPQGQKRSGKAVMYNRQHDSWVLNMGGAHGTPGIASRDNVVSVTGGKAPKSN